jgi:hypothetical protein
MCRMMNHWIASRIDSLDAARVFIQGFDCPAGFSPYAWKQLQKTALAVWHAHLSGRPYRGALNFCRPEFYAMLVQPDGSAIVPTGGIRGYKAA